jgi:hypothetical protein
MKLPSISSKTGAGVSREFGSKPGLEGTQGLCGKSAHDACSAASKCARLLNDRTRPLLQQRQKVLAKAP